MNPTTEHLECIIYGIDVSSEQPELMKYKTDLHEQLDLFLDTQDVVDEDIIADKLRLNQILLNILSNAIKFTKPGGSIRFLIVQLSGAPEGYAKYEFHISGTGIGMREEFTNHIFEPFTREQTSTISGIQGTGLGMSIAKNDEFNVYIIDWLMPDMNGIETVRRIRSIIGKSKPIIILTAYDRTEMEAEAREAGVIAFCSKPLFMSELRDILSKPYRVPTEEPDTNIFSGKKILLVEDNELNMEIAVEILREAGFSVDTADDGTTAVEIMSNAAPGQYDIILMDIQMPKMNGFEATKQIRRMHDHRIADIPIIAMTAKQINQRSVCAQAEQDVISYL